MIYQSKHVLDCFRCDVSACVCAVCVFHPPPVAKQAQFLKQRLRLQEGEDEDEGEEQQQQAGAAVRDKLWGASKRAYYQTGDAEVREGGSGNGQG